MELICFDMDDTLVDADKAHIIAYEKAFKKYGLPKVPDKKLKKMFGRLGKYIVHELFPKLSWERINEIMEENHRVIIEESKRFIKPIPGVKTALRKLHKKYKLAVVSNGMHSEIETILKTSGIDVKLFDVIIGNDEVEHAKPYPDEIFKAEKILHLKASYMVGDTTYDILAGKKARVKTIAVLTGNHTRNMLEKEKPDYIIKSVKDLPKILK